MKQLYTPEKVLFLVLVFKKTKFSEAGGRYAPLAPYSYAPEHKIFSNSLILKFFFRNISLNSKIYSPADAEF